MIVSPTASVASSVAPEKSANLAKSDFDVFLSLLVTELQHQDPTKPMDPTQMVSQLASFSAVEQATKTNSLLQSMLTSSALGQAGSLIGRTVASVDGAVSGVVRSIALGPDGLTAKLTNGATLPLTPDITIS
jgi:flagellar basal-body rod modification protein FlgD